MCLCNVTLGVLIVLAIVHVWLWGRLRKNGIQLGKIQADLRQLHEAENVAPVAPAE